jgi:hypothetical protein
MARRPIRAIRGTPAHRVARTLDAIFELMAIVRELFGHFVDPAGYIAADRRSENHGLADLEFM